MTPPPPTPDPADDERPVRVLLVDDDEGDYVLTRDVVADIPGERRYTLDWVSEFEPAVETICRGEHDVYLVDYRLDAHTGLDVLAAVRRRGSSGPIILLTGLGSSEVDYAAEQAGAVDFLEKHRLEPVTLARAIRYALRQRQQELTLERKVAERTAALTAADRRKNEYLATLAHELRNPLAPIRNALEIMRLASANPAAAVKARDMIERQVSQLVRLIDDLVEVSRYTRDKLDLTRERLDLAEPLKLAAETAQPNMDAGGITFSMHLHTGPLPVDADRVRLVQLVSNLLANAAKYTPPGGNVSLTVGKSGSHAVVTVADTGDGIPPHMLPRVFDLFTQIDKELNRSQTGLGIGLAFARRLAQLHGGDVTASSPGRGRGAEFAVTLPLAAA